MTRNSINFYQRNKVSIPSNFGSHGELSPEATELTVRSASTPPNLFNMHVYVVDPEKLNKFNPHMNNQIHPL